MNIDRRTTKISASTAPRRVGLALALAVVLGACGSTASPVSNEPVANDTTETVTSSAPEPTVATAAPEQTVTSAPESVEVSTLDDPPPASTLDQSMAFGRPVEPFEGNVITAIHDGMVNVFADSSAELLASHPIDAAPRAMEATYQDGAVYVSSRMAPDNQLWISRIDAGGIETLQLGRGGSVAHVFGAPVPAMIVETHAEGAEFIRFHPNGQLDRHAFEPGIAVEATGDVLVLDENNFNGNMWALDHELNLVNAFGVGYVTGRQQLVDSNTVRFATGRGQYDIDLETLQLTSFPFPLYDAMRSEFADGWSVAADGGVLEFFNPDGDVVSEVSTEPLTGVHTFAHPTENIVLVVLRTCENELGNSCSRAESVDTEEAADDESVEEPYDPPNYINVIQFDMDDASITAIDVGTSTGLAAMAVDSGWMVATVELSSSKILNIGRNGDVETIAETPVGAESTWRYVFPVGSRSLGLAAFQGPQIAVVTNEGTQLIDGWPLTNDSALRQYEGQFSHVG